MLAIETNNLSKQYGKMQALRDVTLSVNSGTIFGLLGPNGAGKTTFVKAILDLVSIKSGTVFLDGKVHTSEKARERVSYLPEKFSFFPFYTVENVLDFYAKMRNIEGKTAIEKNLEVAGIIEIRRQKIKTLSKGQLQRVGIASCLIGNPKLLILDEPFSGIDPIGIKDIKTIIQTLNNNGTTVLINSHILTEIEQLCTDMAILHKGQCLAKGDIKTVAGNKSLENFFYDLIKGN